MGSGAGTPGGAGSVGRASGGGAAAGSSASSGILMPQFSHIRTCVRVNCVEMGIKKCRLWIGRECPIGRVLLRNHGRHVERQPPGRRLGMSTWPSARRTAPRSRTPALSTSWSSRAWQRNRSAASLRRVCDTRTPRPWAGSIQREVLRRARPASARQARAFCRSQTDAPECAMRA